MIRRPGLRSVSRRTVQAERASLDPGCRRLRRSEDGAATSEYVAMVLFVAVLVFAVASVPIGESLADALRAAICHIGGGDCAAGSTDVVAPDHSAFQPAHCDTSALAGGSAAEVSVAFFELSAGQRVARTDRSNGEVVLTFEGDRGLGVTGGVGAGLDFGDEGIGGELGGSAAAYAMAGQSWVFDNDDEAKSFLDDYAEHQRWKHRIEQRLPPGAPLVPGVGWLAGKGAELFSEDLPDPGIYHAQAGVRGEGTGGFGASLGPGMSAGLQGALQARGALGVDLDRSKPDPQEWTTTVYLESSGGVSGEFSWLSGAKVGDVEGKAVIKATFDADEELTEVSLVSTKTTTVTDVEGVDESLAGGRTPSGDRRSHGLLAQVSEGERVTTETTTRLPLRNDASRRMAWKFIESGGELTDEFEQYARRHGHHEVLGKVGDATSSSFGLRVALGPKFGFEVSSNSEFNQLVHGEFLGAPDASGNRPMVPMDCVR